VPHLRALLQELLCLTAPGLLLRSAHLSAALRGRAGERLAARHLRREGHRILARNLRHPAAELDLVSATPSHLVITEVKTGRPGPRPFAARFSAPARARQRRAAADLARRHGLLPRLDLIEIHLPYRSPHTDLHHLSNL
jgi:putative endonuclease